MKALEAIRTIKDLLASQNIEEPAAKAKVIVSAVCGDDITTDVSDSSWSKVMRMAGRAGKGEPVEYITGKAYFRYLELAVTPDVLIPRKETELVAGAAIELIQKLGYSTALDMCTGSGCIAISLAAETQAKVQAADISGSALKIAKANAERNNADIKLIESDMFENICGTYDIIVCNPPYISAGEYEKLSGSVREFEPELALKSGDGLIFYRTLADKAAEYLNSGGAIVLEIGAGQAEDAADLLKNGGFADIEIKKDYQGRDRIILAYKRKLNNV